jgi:phosphocarrier protein
MTSASPVQSRSFKIINKRGLHARASARFVQTVEGYDATVRVMLEGSTVGGTSIMGLMMLAAAAGSELEIRASGREAAPALDALVSLVAGGFDET